MLLYRRLFFKQNPKRRVICKIRRCELEYFNHLLQGKLDGGRSPGGGREFWFKNHSNWYENRRWSLLNAVECNKKCRKFDFNFFQLKYWCLVVLILHLLCARSKCQLQEILKTINSFVVLNSVQFHTCFMFGHYIVFIYYVFAWLH